MGESPTIPPSSAPFRAKSPSRLIGLFALTLGCLAFATPMLPTKLAFFALGLTLVFMGVLQRAANFAVGEPDVARMWLGRGGASIVTGLLLMAAPSLTFAALALLLGLSWFLSGASSLIAAMRHRESTDWIWKAADGAVNIVLGIAIAIQWPLAGVVSIGLYLGLRYISAGWSILLGSTEETQTSAADMAGLHPDARLGLAPHPYFGKLCDELNLEEKVRIRSDRAWRWLFIITFFAIHASRMQAEWNFVGMLSPFGAVVSDILLAVVIGYGIVAPTMLSLALRHART